MLEYAGYRLVKTDLCLDSPVESYACLKLGSWLLEVIFVYRLMKGLFDAGFVLPHEIRYAWIQVLG